VRLKKCVLSFLRKLVRVEMSLMSDGSALLCIVCAQLCRGGSRSRDWGHIGPYGERRAQAYNGGLGAVPPAGSRGRAPGQWGKAPWSEHFLCCHMPEIAQRCYVNELFYGQHVYIRNVAVSWVLIFYPWFGGHRPLLPPLPSAPALVTSWLCDETWMRWVDRWR